MHAVTGVFPTYLEQGKPLHHRHDEAEQDPIQQQCPSMRLDVRLVSPLQPKPTRPTRAGSAPTMAHGTRISALPFEAIETRVPCARYTLGPSTSLSASFGAGGSCEGAHLHAGIQELERPLGTCERSVLLCACCRLSL